MKMKIFTISVFILFMLPFCGLAQEPRWLAKLKQLEWVNKVGKLQLLKTTPEESEQILGVRAEESSNPGAHIIKYYTIENGRVTITYTTKECSSKYGKLKKGVIEQIIFHLNSEIPLSKWGISLSQFKKSKEHDTPLLTYENEENGVTLIVGINKTVDPIIFEPAKWLNFKCPD